MKKLFFILLFICIFAVADACFIEPNILIEKNKTLYLPNWDNDLNGLKIAVISDLHIGTKNTNINKINKVIEKINRKNPDIIFILGDYDALSINEKYEPKEVSNALKKLKSKYGTISILGNHDYSPKNVVKKCLKNSGVILLENENLYLYPSGKN